ncbi:hypothetical protein M0804_008259 [Polistes exclamans]|nr:hypothetical protein M0804_008259 [Polistes exclamans]
MELPMIKVLFKETSCPNKNLQNRSVQSMSNIMFISDVLAKRIYNCKNNDLKEKEDTENNDRYWAEKLAALDEDHTKRNKLDKKEIDKLFRKVVNYAQQTNDKACSCEETKVKDCYNNNKCQTLRCNEEVDNFINCVNKMFYKSVRTDNDIFPSNRKYTYNEKFRRGYLFL